LELLAFQWALGLAPVLEQAPASVLELLILASLAFH
jgi:hypothetical protein